MLTEQFRGGKKLDVGKRSKNCRNNVLVLEKGDDTRMQVGRLAFEKSSHILTRGKTE